MSKTFKTVFFLVLAVAFAAPVSALDVEAVTRDNNSLGQQPPGSGEDDISLKMNLQDCREMNAIDVEFALTRDAADDPVNNNLYFFIGNKCNEDVLDADCHQILDMDGYDGDVNRVLVSLWQLFEDIPDVIFGIDGSDQDLEALCTGATEPTGTHQLWAALLSDDTDETSGTWAASVSVEIDIEPPDAPTNIIVGIGQEKATVTWSKEGIDDYDGAYVLYTEADGSGDDAGAAIDGGASSCSGPLAAGDEWVRDGSVKDQQAPQKDVTSATIKPLENGTQYQFSVVSYDEFLNTSVQSEDACGTPWSTCGFYCDYSGSGGSGGGRFCFVATAAFGSYDHPVVRVLRSFRDEFLAVIPGGEAVIQAYYAAGPAMARVVEDNAVLRAAAQVGLTLFAGLAWLFTVAGPSGTALGISVLFAFVVGRRFSRRRRR